MGCKIITSITELIGEVFNDYSKWKTDTAPWFRGEPRNIPEPLTPKVFRKNTKGKYQEKQLLLSFRRQAPALGAPYVPHRDFTDQWLFLAQHVGIPTRLLDWTEGLLIALHFAIYDQEDDCVLWMLNKSALNNKNLEDGRYDKDFTELTWYDPPKVHLRKKDLNELKSVVRGETKYTPTYNISHMNIHAAWTGSDMETPYPYCIPCTNIHPRMANQASQFTIHGKDKISMCDMGLGGGILQKYIIAKEAIDDLNRELRLLGITRSTLFPDLDGLAEELSGFWIE